MQEASWRKHRPETRETRKGLRRPKPMFSPAYQIRLWLEMASWGLTSIGFYTPQKARKWEKHSIYIFQARYPDWHFRLPGVCHLTGLDFVDFGFPALFFSIICECWREGTIKEIKESHFQSAWHYSKIVQSSDATFCIGIYASDYAKLPHVIDSLDGFDYLSQPWFIFPANSYNYIDISISIISGAPPLVLVGYHVSEKKEMYEDMHCLFHQIMKLKIKLECIVAHHISW